jgi:transposase
MWREISAQGYVGKAGMARRYIKRLRVRTKELGVKRQLEIQSAADNFKSPSSRRAAWWLIKEVGELTAEQRLFVDQLIGLCPDIGKVKDLAVSFRRMITRQKAGQFKKWLTKALQSAVTEFRSFADGLKKDQHSILEALRSPWSNGQVEGQSATRSRVSSCCSKSYRIQPDVLPSVSYWSVRCWQRRGTEPPGQRSPII